jgi:hypothetical protein
MWVKTGRVGGKGIGMGPPLLAAENTLIPLESLDLEHLVQAAPTPFPAPDGLVSKLRSLQLGQ